jgi:hypothetical protein
MTKAVAWVGNARNEANVCPFLSVIPGNVVVFHFRDITVLHYLGFDSLLSQ